MMLGQSRNGQPQPPERGSSFAIMSQAQQSLLVRSPTTTTSTTSLNNTPTNTVPPLENIREDPNHFIKEAETMLASPVSPETTFTGNSTPGVIGAQEVYKDPRQQRLTEQQQQKLLSYKGGASPEKLSFEEKMKMFAMETDKIRHQKIK